MSLVRELCALAFPIVGANLLFMTMFVVDAIMCGRLPHGETALAAIGFGLQILWFFAQVMTGLTTGTVALVARAYGARDFHRLGNIIDQSTTLALAFGFALAAIGAPLAPTILRVLGAAPEIVDESVSYLRPLLLGLPVLFLSQLYTGVMRGLGNTRLPLACMVGGNVLNIVLNYALLFGHFGMPALGVRGCAIAMVSSNLVQSVALASLLRRGAVADLRLQIGLRRIDRALAAELVKIGWPTALDAFVYQVAMLLQVAMLARVDEFAVVAHMIGERVFKFAFVPSLAFMHAAGAIVGNALGAGDIEKARQTGLVASAVTTVVVLTVVLGLVLGSGPIFSMFDVTPGTVLDGHAHEYMWAFAGGAVIIGVHAALLGLLLGAGATLTALQIAIAGTTVQLVLSWLLAFGLGLGAVGVWAATAASVLVRTALELVVFRRGAWAVTGTHVTH
jgi:putative MATE family efflux protein